MFCWASSFAMDFLIPNELDLNKTIERFENWYDKEGFILFNKFKDIPYPVMPYTQESLDTYFNGNCKIGAELEKSINKYCGIDINDSFNEEEK